MVFAVGAEDPGLILGIPGKAVRDAAFILENCC